MLCFLAGAQYSHKDLKNEIQRSKTMCWIGQQDIIEKEIMEAGNVQQVINKEITQFRKDFNEVMQEMYTVGRYK